MYQWAKLFFPGCLGILGRGQGAVVSQRVYMDPVLFSGRGFNAVSGGYSHGRHSLYGYHRRGIMAGERVQDCHLSGSPGYQGPKEKHPGYTGQYGIGCLADGGIRTALKGPGKGRYGKDNSRKCLLPGFLQLPQRRRCPVCF